MPLFNVGDKVNVKAEHRDRIAVPEGIGTVAEVLTLRSSASGIARFRYRVKYADSELASLTEEWLKIA